MHFLSSQGNLSRHHTLMHPNINNRSNTGKGGSSTATSSNNKTVTYTNNSDMAAVTYEEEDQSYDDQDQGQQQWDWSQVEASYSTDNPEECQEGENQDVPDDAMPPFEMTPNGKI